MAPPAVVLVDPQLPDNIGAVARAMWNCGLTDLRLVRPREGWPHPRAEAAAAGADPVLQATTVHGETAAAVADLEAIWATTGRSRDMVKPVQTPREAVAEMRRRGAAGERCGILFGPERTGLTNDDCVLADRIVSVPLNPEFRSLNLAQAVMVLAYEWFQAGDRHQPPDFDRGARPATREELLNFFDHLERRLDAGGFLHPPEKRPIMVRNLRNVFTRAGLTEQEVRTLHGVVAALSGRRDPDG